MAILFASIVVAGAGFSYASLKERQAKESTPVESEVATKAVETAAPSPVESIRNESEVNSARQYDPYEEQGRLMREKLAAKNEAMLHTEER